MNAVHAVVGQRTSTMANSERPRPDPICGNRIQRRSIPTNLSGQQYADELDHYLEQLLDEAFEETLPASGSAAVATRRVLDKR